MPERLKENSQGFRGVFGCLPTINTRSEGLSTTGESRSFNTASGSAIAASSIRMVQPPPIPDWRFNATSVQIDQSLYQRQPKAEAAATSIERAIRLRENLKMH